MQFLINAYDYTDGEALQRRLAAREKHLEVTKKMYEAGRYLYAAALLDNDEKMIGSVIIAEFESREALDALISEDPYVVGKVWERIEIKKCKVGAMFLNNG